MTPHPTDPMCLPQANACSLLSLCLSVSLIHCQSARNSARDFPAYSSCATALLGCTPFCACQSIASRRRDVTAPSQCLFVALSDVSLFHCIEFCISASLPLCISASLHLCLSASSSASLHLCISASLHLCISASVCVCACDGCTAFPFLV